MPGVRLYHGYAEGSICRELRLVLGSRWIRLARALVSHLVRFLSGQIDPLIMASHPLKAVAQVGRYHGILLHLQLWLPLVLSMWVCYPSELDGEDLMASR